MSVIVIGVLAVLVVVLFVLLRAKRKRFKTFIGTFLRIFYGQGFSDRKQGRPKQSWDTVPFMADNCIEKVMMRVYEKAYHEGYSDADKGVYDLAGKIAKFEKDILDGFEELNKVVNRSVNNF